MNVIIIGGGITGLTLAYRLQQKHPHIRYTLLESSPQLGGKIASFQQETPFGTFLLEQAADCFLTSKPSTLQLARELGLQEELIPTQDANRVIYVLKNGKPVPLPDGTMLVVPTRFMPFITSPLFSPLTKLRMGLDLLIPRAKHPLADESIASFIRRRLGTKALHLLAEPLLSGIYNADPTQQSLQATFPRLAQLENRHRSLIWGMLKSKPPASATSSMSLFMSFQNGMQTLISSLVKQLTGHLQTQSPVLAIQHVPSGGYVVTTPSSQLQAQHVIITTSAHTAARMLPDDAMQAKQLLLSLNTSSSQAVFLAYQNHQIKKPLTGFGIVVPKGENRPINAITFVSQKLTHRSPPDCSLFRVFFGSNAKDTFNLDDQALTSLAINQLNDLLGVNGDPIFSRIFRMHNASPQYHVGHLELMKQIETALPQGLHVAGSPYRGVGVPDCIANAYELAENIDFFSRAIL